MDLSTDSQVDFVVSIGDHDSGENEEMATVAEQNQPKQQRRDRRDYTTAIVGGQPRGGGFGRHRSYRGGDCGGCNHGGRTNSITNGRDRYDVRYDGRRTRRRRPDAAALQRRQEDRR